MTAQGALSEQPLHPTPKACLSALPPILPPLVLSPLGNARPPGSREPRDAASTGRKRTEGGYEEQAEHIQCPACGKH